jgi:homoserine dehydrogenase
MSTVVDTVQHARPSAVAAAADIRIGLLGLGHVGSAIAALARDSIAEPHRFTVAAALVRSTDRIRSIDTSDLTLTTDAATVLASKPDVIVEVLGGLEPARTLVLAALADGIPVVTANKSLLAAHGDELIRAAATTGAPLLHEASVLAGVPFLGAFSRRPLARDVTALCGIVNGTSNVILSRMRAERAGFRQALDEAQRVGFAEPDPSKDVEGDDAVEKLCVLIRHFGGIAVEPGQVRKQGIAGIEPFDLECAGAFDGAVRPIVSAEWSDGQPTACAGPAFVPSTHPLARVEGVQNALALRTRWSGDLFFSGPGAGPSVTAATVLDDVVEAHREPRAVSIPRAVRTAFSCRVPETGWFIRLVADDLSDAQQAPVLLGGLGIRMRRVSPVVERAGRQWQWLLTSSCSEPHAAAALDVLEARTGCSAWRIRALD